MARNWTVLNQFPMGYQELLYPLSHQNLAKSWTVPVNQEALLLFSYLTELRTLVREGEKDIKILSLTI